MEGQILHFRRGRHTQKDHQMLIRIQEIETKEKAQSLIHKTVVWTSLGKLQKKIRGKITNIHGNKGVLRVQFERGLPGQSIGTKVQIE